MKEKMVSPLCALEVQKPNHWPLQAAFLFLVKNLHGKKEKLKVILDLLQSASRSALEIWRPQKSSGGLLAMQWERLPFRVL